MIFDMIARNAINKALKGNKFTDEELNEMISLEGKPLEDYLEGVFERREELDEESEVNTEEIATTVKKMLDKKKSITFLLVGRTGVGKSSTINSLLGAEVAPISKYRATTMEVITYPHNHDGLHYNIVDTPGLCDDLAETGNDLGYLENIRKSAETADCVWFVTELDAARVTGDEKRGIKLISEALGEEIWSRSIIVFTRADKVEASEFEKDLSERTQLIKKEIEKYSPRNAKKIPAVAVSNRNSLLPNGKPWLGELFTQVYIRFSDEGSIPFLLSMKKDFVPQKKEKGANEGITEENPRIELDDAQKEKIKESTFKRILAGMTSGTAIGVKIGSKFGPIGTAIGGALGAISGGVLGWLFS